MSEQINIYQNKVVVKDRDKLLHSLSVDIIHLGDDAPCTIRIEGHATETVLKAGYNHVDINLPKVDEPTDFKASISIQGRATQERTFTLSPVKEWEIFLVQHTHSDIGYTRPQTEILAEHLRYIDHALDYCDLTDHFPEASQFRWTCETSWSVREYLTSRPEEQIDRLLKRIREGRIEATGMFLNFSEIIDEPALAAQTKTLRMLKNRGIDVSTAMQNDVNGIAWCLVDYFHHTDVKYLTMGVHAHRARLPFNKPTAFWWQSPAGNRLLAYRSEHYMHGNALSLLGGQQDVFRANLSRYLTGLEEKGYPYHKISLQFSGYITDNSPPSMEVCDIIREWNKKYEWPKLRSALAKDFMMFL
ncbi:MAG: glycosyl hydrolase family 38, partial [Bacteroidales bacterium]|nr:glycosyl hydrolase family 38 [Bacteroidales bacterium]